MCRNMKQKLNYHPCQRHGRIHMLHTYFSNFQYVGMYNKKSNLRQALDMLVAIITCTTTFTFFFTHRNRLDVMCFSIINYLVFQFLLPINSSKYASSSLTVSLLPFTSLLQVSQSYRLSQGRSVIVMCVSFSISSCNRSSSTMSFSFFLL